ncbi:hydantoinase/oxoprolinase family protein [Pelagibius sp. Alg239-R121]|uniref:hydantoinase/oxoprolinase family protein n=1 Tax=Pelagibius sp. Alg239-R121 TaxID=2993448 RepID=UPI0024A63427|nr:hydantoinase/oxoprolinase family protein [Pelagibius sp. Alg239-R121]
MESPTRLRIAVDIGGTFTDVVLAGAGDRILATTKTPTTSSNPTIGAVGGVEQVIAEAGIAMGDIGGFIHGTTLATNALIERRGAKVAGITTAGFRDILEIAYERRYSQYEINLEKPDFLVPRARCFTVPERMSADGAVITPLDEAAIDGLIDELDTSGAEAVAICLLHAYANPAHEQRLRDLLQARRPALTLSLSSDVSPEAREFERLCTTIANAYVQPLMSAYLTDFAETFAAKGLSCPILMMTAGGGMTTIETASRLPIRLVESGPAGGAILAAQVAASCGADSVLSFDMGGTTAKLCLIDDYRPQTSRQFEISRAARFIKGSGMPARIPVVEMIEIGAGGGSMASVDRLGRLSVGPQSAGSEPGPAAFGKGGTSATVTDADVVLGFIDPDAFAEGRLNIDVPAAQAALQIEVGNPLETDAAGAAIGVSQIVDESMASAGRMHAVESGKDLSARTMIAFGGNGPLHATRVARRAGVSDILIPRDPGVGSAVGFLFAPVAFEIVRSRYALLDRLDIADLNRLFDAMIMEAEDVVRIAAPDDELLCTRTAFMRYHGQGHEIEIAMPDREVMAEDVPALRTAFESEYQRQFSRAVPGMEIEILNWAIRVSTADRQPQAVAAADDAQYPAPNQTRAIRCEISGETLTAGLFHRAQLKPGDRIPSPALIVEPQTTTLVSSGFSAEVDGAGNLRLTAMDAEGVLI